MRARRASRVVPAAGIALAIFAALASLVLASACDPARRAIGDTCLKNTDCLSGVCSARACVAAPPELPATLATDAGEDDGGALADGAETGAEAAASDASEDTTPVVDDAKRPDAAPNGTGADASPDGASSPVDGAPLDAAPQEG